MINKFLLENDSISFKIIMSLCDCSFSEAQEELAKIDLPYTIYLQIDDHSQKITENETNFIYGKSAHKEALAAIISTEDTFLAGDKYFTVMNHATIKFNKLTRKDPPKARPAIKLEEPKIKKQPKTEPASVKKEEPILVNDSPVMKESSQKPVKNVVQVKPKKETPVKSEPADSDSQNHKKAKEIHNLLTDEIIEELRRGIQPTVTIEREEIEINPDGALVTRTVKETKKKTDDDIESELNTLKNQWLVKHMPQIKAKKAKAIPQGSVAGFFVKK